MVSPFQGSGLLVTDNLGLRFASAQAITLRAFSPPDPGATTSATQSSNKASQAPAFATNEL
jgi:hypothetical protein